MKKPDYKTNDPKGWMGDPKRGAALGRATIQDAPASYSGKLTLRRVRLNGDYDQNGTYWGGGPGTLPLYWCANASGTIDYCLRAASRYEARNLVLAKYPNARFYN